MVACVELVLSWHERMMRVMSDAQSIAYFHLNRLIHANRLVLIQLFSFEIMFNHSNHFTLKSLRCVFVWCKVRCACAHSDSTLHLTLTRRVLYLYWSAFARSADVPIHFDVLKYAQFFWNTIRNEQLVVCTNVLCYPYAMGWALVCVCVCFVAATLFGICLPKSI